MCRNVSVHIGDHVPLTEIFVRLGLYQLTVIIVCKEIEGDPHFHAWRFREHY